MSQRFYSLMRNIFALLLTLSWLIPNHYWPWVGFHADLWMVACLGGYALVLIWTNKTEISLTRSAIVLLLFSFLPSIQYFLKLIYFSGDVIVYSLYLFGLFLSFSVAAGMKQADGYRLIDCLFFAIATASLLSVGLQLCQYFGFVDGLGVWAIDASGGRPAANFSQPNNLGTFLLWGGLAFFWFWVRGVISANISIFAIAYLLIGVALTQSRTSVLAGMLVVVLLIRWRHQKKGRRVLLVACLGLIWLLCWLKIVSLIAPFFPLGELVDRFSDAATVFKDPIRLAIYKEILGASLEKPWFGFGFDGVGEAFFTVAENFPPIGVVVLHTHNIFLDLIIWLGWPIGLFFVFLLVSWFFSHYVSAHTRERQILYIFVLVVSVHAMLELPLHYAVFLFPTGMVAGVLSRNEGARVVWRLPAWFGAAVICFGVALSAMVARDYILVEERIISLRLSRYNIVQKHDVELEPIILLNQFSSFLKFSYDKPSENHQENDLLLGERLMSIGFNPLNLLHFIEMLVVAGRDDDARRWMRKSLTMVGEHLYEDMGRQWVRDGERLAALNKITWVPYSASSRD